MDSTSARKIYRCNGLVADCGVTFEGTQSEVEQLAIGHAERDHGISGSSSEMAGRVRSSISNAG